MRHCKRYSLSFEVFKEPSPRFAAIRPKASQAAPFLAETAFTRLSGINQSAGKSREASVCVRKIYLSGALGIKSERYIQPLAHYAAGCTRSRALRPEPTILYIRYRRSISMPNPAELAAHHWGFAAFLLGVVGLLAFMLGVSSCLAARHLVAARTNPSNPGSSPPEAHACVSRQNSIWSRCSS